MTLEAGKLEFSKGKMSTPFVTVGEPTAVVEEDSGVEEPESLVDIRLRRRF
jgi:hypothetical protein